MNRSRSTPRRFSRLAAENAAAHIRAMDLEQFYGNTMEWDNASAEEQEAMTDAKNNIARMIEKRWRLNDR